MENNFKRQINAILNELKSFLNNKKNCLIVFHFLVLISSFIPLGIGIIISIAYWFEYREKFEVINLQAKEFVNVSCVFLILYFLILLVSGPVLLMAFSFAMTSYYLITFTICIVEAMKGKAFRYPFLPFRIFKTF